MLLAETARRRYAGYAKHLSSLYCASAKTGAYVIILRGWIQRKKQDVYICHLFTVRRSASSIYVLSRLRQASGFYYLFFKLDSFFPHVIWLIK